jgi:hypothetical protein
MCQLSSTEAQVVIYYEDAGTSTLPTSQPQMYSIIGCVNDALERIIPTFEISPREPETTNVLDATVGQNATGVWLWHMNKVSFRTDFSNPVIHLAKEGNFSYPHSLQ